MKEIKQMKFIVDELPYYGEDCPFSAFVYDDACYECPRYWDKYFICSDENPHECSYLIEFDKYMSQKSNT